MVPFECVPSIQFFDLVGNRCFESFFVGFYFVVQLFFSYFKELVGKEVTVELKNDLAIRGTLHSVDQYLNIKLENTKVVDEDKYPHMVGFLHSYWPNNCSMLTKLLRCFS